VLQNKEADRTLFHSPLENYVLFRVKEFLWIAALSLQKATTCCQPVGSIFVPVKAVLTRIFSRLILESTCSATTTDLCISVWVLMHFKLVHKNSILLIYLRHLCFPRLHTHPSSYAVICKSYQLNSLNALHILSVFCIYIYTMKPVAIGV